MNDKDKEAFEKWELDYFGQNDNCPHYMLHIKNTWQAACEYKDMQLINGSKMKQMNDRIENLKEENKKLREVLEFYAEPWECEELDGELLVREIGSYNNFREVHSIARKALKKYRGGI